PPPPSHLHPAGGAYRPAPGGRSATNDAFSALAGARDALRAYVEVVEEHDTGGGPSTEAEFAS
ncbi:MAG: hypothetical protein L0H96_25130, partial [Humibacillus sp.]|nr:hypothetical protein [Humibacillus sp.]